MKRYTAGFGLSHDQERVLLIHKNRGPSGVKGRWNGIGGKIEDGETAAQCQRREYREETGLDIPEERWELAVALRGPHTPGAVDAHGEPDLWAWEVFFFRADLTIEESNSARTVEDEEVHQFRMHELWHLNVVPNVRWLVHLMRDRHLELPISIREVG